MSGLSPEREAPRSRRLPSRLPFSLPARLLRSILGASCCSAYAASVTAGPAHPGRLDPAWPALYDQSSGVTLANRTTEVPTVVISSWAVISVISRGRDSFDKNVLPALTAGVRGAIADMLEVCRPSVSVRSIKSGFFGSFEEDVSLAAIIRRRTHPVSLVDHADRIIRRVSAESVMHPKTRFLQVEATYEVRIEDSVGLSDAEIAHRVDSLQLYSRFSDLNLLLRRWLDSNPAPQGIMELALSDLGYASRRTEQRQPFSTEQAGACMEEGLLREAKLSHQYVVVAALVMSVFIACVGSLVFAIKAPSHVPSRMNPLLPPAGQ